MSFAAALPLGALERALTWPGWRPKSRSALKAVVFVRMPLEGPADWSVVKAYFREQVGRLLLPPPQDLVMGNRVVDVSPPRTPRALARPRRRRGSPK